MSDLLRSFIEVDGNSHFPIQNLPYGIFSPPGAAPRPGVAIGEQVLDLALLERRGFFGEANRGETAVFQSTTLNSFMARGPAAWAAVRQRLQELLRHDNSRLRDDAELRGEAFWPMTAVTLHLPAAIGDYTDFYSSQAHASNVGKMFGRERPLLPNWRHLPVAYHGRASSVVISGTSIRRPSGQVLPSETETPVFRPTAELDFELELGFFVGPGNRLGEPIAIEEAAAHIFGLVLVNDWSARDVQRWEYRPLGPFLAKNFATSISPWIVPLAALQPFRVSGPSQKPSPLPYLRRAAPWTFDIELEAALQTPEMIEWASLSRGNARHLYWDMAQQLAHHTATGCNLRPGDLLASGTISGPEPGTYGSLLELSWRGERPLTLPNGERRTFLEDGDRVRMSGWCQGEGYRVGFGEVNGIIVNGDW